MHPQGESINEFDLPNKHFRTCFTGENKWYTPKKYIEAAKEVMGAIDLDPASSDEAQKTVIAERYYTEQDDGLKQDWFGRVWLNPPYSQPLIYLFVDKLVSEYEKNKISDAILLTNNFTDTAWFHLAESQAALICFTRGRIRFQGSTSQPTQGSAFFYFGDNKYKFLEVFKEFGFIR
jgi:phage N-6-adenine-methyltransferase